LWAMRSGQTLEGVLTIAAVVNFPQTPKWAKRSNTPPTRQPNQATRSREYLTPDEVESMIVAARRGGGRVGERDALLS
jgi:hypothetical protein